MEPPSQPPPPLWRADKVDPIKGAASTSQRRWPPPPPLLPFWLPPPPSGRPAVCEEQSGQSNCVRESLRCGVGVGGVGWSRLAG